ncbi:hypothetical protein [Nocardia sp. NPDC004711]
MSNDWKAVSVLVPSHLTGADLRQHIHAEVEKQATAAGEWAGQIHIGKGVHHSDGIQKWGASYLPGTPGVFTE